MADDRGKLPELADFPRGRVVLTVGRWAASERYKGVDLLIGAIAQLRGTHSGFAFGSGGLRRRSSSAARSCG